MILSQRLFFVFLFKESHFSVYQYAQVADAYKEKGHNSQYKYKHGYSHLLVIEKGVGESQRITSVHFPCTYHNKSKIKIGRYKPEKGSLCAPSALSIKKQPVCHYENGCDYVEKNGCDTRGGMSIEFTCNDCGGNYPRQCN